MKCNTSKRLHLEELKDLNSSYYRLVYKRQRPLKGLVIGAFVALSCSVIWHGFTYMTGAELEEIAAVIGIIVGLTLRKFGQFISPLYGVVGVILTLMSCFIGRFLNVIHFIFFLRKGKITSIIEDFTIYEIWGEIIHELSFYDVPIVFAAISGSFYFSYIREFELIE